MSNPDPTMTPLDRAKWEHGRIRRRLTRLVAAIEILEAAGGSLSDLVRSVEMARAKEELTDGK